MGVDLKGFDMRGLSAQFPPSRLQAEEKQKVEALASKQQVMLKKFQAKWEEIKKSAREKEKAKKEKAADKGHEVVDTVDNP